ncbi:MAG: hypothetical protein RI897_4054 [Verrucomicrobiota bacterium]|jgi:hypothetical protein
MMTVGFIDEVSPPPGSGEPGNEHPISYHGTPPAEGAEWLEGMEIQDPVWMLGRAFGEASKNEPVCYTRSTAQVPSHMRTELFLQTWGGPFTFDLIGNEGETEYFRKNGITAGPITTDVDVTAQPELPQTLEKLSKEFLWRADLTVLGTPLTFEVGHTTHTVYTVFDAPIRTVEGESNNPTQNRLDFCLEGGAEHKSDKVEICGSIAAEVDSRLSDASSYGAVPSPRWLIYAEEYPPLDCNHAAACAASAFGIVGIQGYVHQVYGTCVDPQEYPRCEENSTVNDYVDQYMSSTVLKFEQEALGGPRLRLVFEQNNFEGCVRVTDGSTDDGSAWWTIYPLRAFSTSKLLFTWYGTEGAPPQQWVDNTTLLKDRDEPLPLGLLGNRPSSLGGGP